MPTVRLKKRMFLQDKFMNLGDIVELNDADAKYRIGMGEAELADGATTEDSVGGRAEASPDTDGGGRGAGSGSGEADPFTDGDAGDES